MTSEYFFLIVSMNDLLLWDEAQENCEPNPYLRKVVNALNVDVDLLSLRDYYFDQVLVGRGDVYLYKEQANADSLIAFDLYKEPTDQLDLISISIRCDGEAIIDVRDNIRLFFDMASCRVCLEESKLSARVLDKVDEHNYPRDVEVSKYRQKLRVYLANE